jgi:hypothetical protein
MFVKLCNGYFPENGNRFPKGLDALNLVHSFGGEVRLSTAGTRPHWYALDDEECFATSKATSYVAQLRFRMATRGAKWIRGGKP